MSDFMAKMHQILFRLGFAPDPAGEANDAPPDPLVGWGGGNPLPIPHPLAPWALPQIFSSRTAPGARGYCVAEL